MKCDTCEHTIIESQDGFIHSKTKSKVCHCGCSNPSPFISRVKKRGDTFYKRNIHLINFLKDKSKGKTSFFTVSDVIKNIPYFFDGENTYHMNKIHDVEEWRYELLRSGCQNKIGSVLHKISSDNTKKIKKIYAEFCRKNGRLVNDWRLDDDFKSRFNEAYPIENTTIYTWLYENPIFYYSTGKVDSKTYYGYKHVLEFKIDEMKNKAKRNGDASNYQYHWLGMLEKTPRREPPTHSEDEH